MQTKASQGTTWLHAMEKSRHQLLAPRRSRRANQRLGAILAFVAGAANAGGFIAVGKYSSHMTGVTSSIAASLALGDLRMAGLGLAMLLAFMSGAASTTFLVNWARRSAHRNPYVLPLLLESLLLLVFGLFEGAGGGDGAAGMAFAEILLAFMMGLQNALIAKVAHAEIRTTHVTGMVTDLGIELGKLFYWNKDKAAAQPRVLAKRQKIRALLLIFGSFFFGGLAGALGFKDFGYYAVLPLALGLLAVVTPQIKRPKLAS